MRWLKDLFARRPETEVVPPPDNHTQNQMILERNGLKQISYDQVVNLVPRAATEDILLSDKPDVRPGDTVIHTFFSVWIPRVCDPSMIELAPCSTFGNSMPEPWNDHSVITIRRDNPYFSLVIFPQYWDKSGNRVSLADVRSGAEHKRYDEEAFAVSTDGTMIEHRRGWKRLC